MLWKESAYMNRKLYDAVFGCGEQKIDPFENTNVDFDRMIDDMRTVGYEITSLNIAEYVVIQELDEINREKHRIVESVQDRDDREDYCRENYGSSFKDIMALDPKTDFEWDLKSGKVILYLSPTVDYKSGVYNAVFRYALEDFSSKTGFEYRL